MKRIVSILTVVAVFSLLFLSCKDKKECPEEVTVRDCPEVIANCLTEEEEKGLRAGTKKWNEVWDDMKERCPEVAAYDNGASIAALTSYPKLIFVHGKVDMVEALKKYVEKNNCCIKTLRINGHGKPGQISTGDGKKKEDCKYINGTEEDMKKWKEDLKDLKDILCPGATIILQSCRTAEGETGLKKLQEIAAEYGVTVIGATVVTRTSTNVEDLPDEQKRIVTPPIETPAKPQDGEPELLEKKAARKLLNEMSIVEQNPFQKIVKEMAIYPVDKIDMPNISQNPDLPIKDSIWINEFVESIIDSLAFLDTAPLAIESSSIVLVRYVDGTYQYSHGIYGNRMYSTSDNDGYVLIYPVNEKGLKLFRAGLELSSTAH